MMKHKKWFSLATLLFITPNLLAHPVRQGERLSQSFAVSRGGSLEVDIEGGDIRIVNELLSSITFHVNLLFSEKE